MRKLLLSAVVMLFSFANFAGTLFFKDGNKLSGVEIISINDGEIIIEKDKGKRNYSLSKIKSFFQSDIAEDSGEVPGDFADYKVKIIDIKVPKKGTDKKKTAVVEIEYAISKKGSSKKIKKPYFYLYVMTPRKDGDGKRVYRYYYPKDAKPRGKDYDEAAIMAELQDFKRDYWRSKHMSLKANLSCRKIEIPLKSIGSRDVLAWHLEVWGNTEKLVDTGEDIRNLHWRKPVKNWWKKYDY